MSYQGRMSRAAAERILAEECARHGVSVADVRAQVKRTKRPILFCRVQVSRRLDELGASTIQIGDFLGGINSSTISYYLGRCSRGKPTKPKWQPPRILPYLIPYAGADFNKYAN